MAYMKIFQRCEGLSLLSPSYVGLYSRGVNCCHTQFKLFKPSRCIKASFYIHENRPNFATTKGFRMQISMKLVYQYVAIFFNFLSTSSHHPLQVENCDSNSRLVVDEDDNGKLRVERVKINPKPYNAEIDLFKL